jgi:hypothetical protein
MSWLIFKEMNMTQVILKKLNPIVIEKLKHLAQSHQRTLEEEITSILEDVTENTPIITSKSRDWSPGFFEHTCGAWQGELLVREPQPEAQEREPLL